jgi:hypothetical protein
MTKHVYKSGDRMVKEAQRYRKLGYTVTAVVPNAGGNDKYILYVYRK